jgi:hypothetical protein
MRTGGVRSHFPSARLTLAFAAISVVTLLAGAAFVFILRESQIRWKVNRARS